MHRWVESLPHDYQLVVVEDHDLVREELLGFLNRPGWVARGAACGEALDGLLREQAADIVLLDLNLPDEDGLAISRRLRERFPGLGLIMLTARGLSSDKAAGYQHGADVYLTKPLNIAELEASLANLARRISPQAGPALCLDLGQQLLRLGPHQVRLTGLECRLLHELSLAPRQCLGAQDLLDRACRGAATPEQRRHFAVTISRLRTKVGLHLGLEPLIKAVYGHGYELVGSLRIER